MRLTCITICVLYYRCEPVWAQEAVDPAYLRQYYAQIQANPQRAETPIHEPQADQEPAQQYVAPAAPQRQYQVPRPVQPAQPARQYVQQDSQAYQQPQYSPKASKPKLAANLEEDPEEYDPNPSYQFGFDVKDDEYTNYQNRKEVRDGGIIQGSYTVVDSDGFIRTVKYTAHPKDGFKAEVIREPTDIVIKMPEQVRQNQEQLLQQQRREPAFHQQPQQHQQPQRVQHQQLQQQQPEHVAGGSARYRLPNIPDNVRAAYQQQ